VNIHADVLSNAPARKSSEKSKGQDTLTVEREMGFEPTTAALEGRNSSAELLPLITCHLAIPARRVTL
ncbi:uncharacterized protein METZ01_LOCUS452467, partial [marine metagenome]